MKKLILFAASAVMLCSCTKIVTVSIENTVNHDRSEELVEIPTADLAAITLKEGQAYVVSNWAGEVVPSQLTHDGLLLFQSGLDADAKASFTIKAGAPQPFATKTYGRFAPERYDDFIWENDRVGFRIYGAALAPIDGPSNGIDALYKRTEEMILDKWYAASIEQGLSYHDDNGTGLDDYKVGRTLGAGGMAPWIDGKLVLNSNFTGQEVLDNGPLRTTFRLTYPDLEIEGRKVAEVRTFSIDAGSQMTRVVEEYDVRTPTMIAIGFPLHAESVKYALWGDVMIVEEPATAKASGVYLGLVVPTGVFNSVEDEYEVPEGEKGAGVFRHILAINRYTPGKPFVYYTGFGWENSGGWTSEKFSEYLHFFAVAKKTPFVVNIAKK